MIIDSPRRREQLAAVAQRLPAHVARLAWSADQIKAERPRALREMLAFAKSKSPWHGARLGQVEPQSFTEGDLGTLPVMIKADVMTNWDDIVTDRRLTLAGRNANIAAKLNGTCKDYYYFDDYLVIATGGSSGVQGVFPWGWDEFIEIACVTFRYQLRDEPPGAGRTGKRPWRSMQSATAYRSRTSTWSCPLVWSVKRGSFRDQYASDGTRRLLWQMPH
jgi:hypothetical protein